jgi:O-antigen/teichoic acid export membrane protein
MLENIKLTIKNSLIYALGNVAIKLVGLILIPVYTDVRFLSKDDFGALGILEASSMLIVAMLGLALTQALTRWYWDKKYLEKQASVFFTVLIFLTVLSVLVVFALIPFTGYFSEILFKVPDYSHLILLMLVSSVLMVVSQVPLTLLKLQSKPGLYSFSNVSKLIITLVLTIYFVIWEKRGLEGIFEAQIIGNIFFFLILSRYIIKNIIARFEYKILVEMFTFSFPLVLGSVSGILLATFDRYTLNYMAGLQDVGVYSLGFKIANAVKLLVVTSIQLAISPMIFKMMDKEGNKRFYSKIMTYSGFVVMFVILAVSLFSIEIVKVFSSNIFYWRSHTVIPVISLSIFFGMLKDASVTGLQITKKTKVIGVVILMIALLNLGLNIAFIPVMNIMGAAVATLLSQIIFFIVILIYAQKHYPIPYELGKIGKLVITGMVLYSLSLLTLDSSLALRLVIKVVILISFPFMLWVIGFYDEIELDTLKNAWKSWKNPGNWKSNLKRYSEKNRD